MKHIPGVGGVEYEHNNTLGNGGGSGYKTEEDICQDITDTEPHADWIKYISTNAARTWQHGETEK